MASTKKRLTYKQIRFVEAYLGPAQFNCAEACRLAGYSVKNTGPARLLNYPLIEQEIRRRCLKIAPRLEMDGNDIRRGFARIASDPRSERQGGPSFMARNKALRELGLINGLYTNKIQVTGSLTLIELLMGASAPPAALPPPVAEQPARLPPAESTFSMPELEEQPQGA